MSNPNVCICVLKKIFIRLWWLISWHTFCWPFFNCFVWFYFFFLIIIWKRKCVLFYNNSFLYKILIEAIWNICEKFILCACVLVHKVPNKKILFYVHLRMLKTKREKIQVSYFYRNNCVCVCVYSLRIDGRPIWASVQVKLLRFLSRFLSL